MVIVDCIVLHYMHIWHLRIRASSVQFRASKINMALARMDKLVKKLMSNTEYVCFVYFMVFNATFNNISAISWRSVLLVEENGVPGESYRPVACH